MSSYYPSFNYRGLNSLKDKNLIVVSFDADQGEKDTFLGMEPIYTNNAYGTHRLDYGARYNNVAVVKTSVMKKDGSDFTVNEVRNFLSWTTGARKTSYLDLLIGDDVQFSFLGRVTNVYQQKLDARTIGFTIEFTSVSPWAYSPIQHANFSLEQQSLTLDADGTLEDKQAKLIFDDNSGCISHNGIQFSLSDDGAVCLSSSTSSLVDNPSDDLYTYAYLNTTFINGNGDSLSIKNVTLGEETVIKNLSVNEVIQLSAEQFITSDVPNKIFGDDFNFVWPRLAPGNNEFVIKGLGNGSVTMSYRYPIKIGDCAIDVDALMKNVNC